MENLSETIEKKRQNFTIVHLSFLIIVTFFRNIYKKSHHFYSRDYQWFRSKEVHCDSKQMLLLLSILTFKLKHETFTLPMEYRYIICTNKA